jgi:hypothetical protein
MKINENKGCKRARERSVVDPDPDRCETLSRIQIRAAPNPKFLNKINAPLKKYKFLFF